MSRRGEPRGTEGWLVAARGWGKEGMRTKGSGIFPWVDENTLEVEVIVLQHWEGTKCH